MVRVKQLLHHYVGKKTKSSVRACSPETKPSTFWKKHQAVQTQQKSSVSKKYLEPCGRGLRIQIITELYPVVAFKTTQLSKRLSTQLQPPWSWKAVRRVWALVWNVSRARTAAANRLFSPAADSSVVRTLENSPVWSEPLRFPNLQGHRRGGASREPLLCQKERAVHSRAASGFWSAHKLQFYRAAFFFMQMGEFFKRGAEIRPARMYLRR